MISSLGKIFIVRVWFSCKRVHNWIPNTFVKWNHNDFVASFSCCCGFFFFVSSQRLFGKYAGGNWFSHFIGFLALPPKVQKTITFLTHHRMERFMRTIIVLYLTNAVTSSNNSDYLRLSSLLRENVYNSHILLLLSHDVTEAWLLLITSSFSSVYYLCFSYLNLA